MHIIYCTTKNKEEALTISSTLIKESLAACTNILDGMTSVYMWEGKVEESSEAILIVKTNATMVPAVIKRIEEIHSYEVPCVFSIKIEECSKDFLKWLETSLKLPY